MPALTSGQLATADKTPPLLISPLTIDGGTTLRVEGVALDDSSAAFRGVVASVRAERSRAEAERDARTNRIHFLMLRPAPWQKGTRRRRFGARGWKSGRRGERVELHIEGVAHVRFDLDKKVAEVQLKAKSLWAYGYRAVASWLIRALHEELFEGNQSRLEMLDYQRPLETSSQAGWYVHAIELCADATGLEWLREDASNFVGRTKSGTMESREKDAEAWGSSGSPVAETINIARRNAPVSLCLYQKTLQIEQAKGADRSTYEPTWRAHGWNGRASVQRVELRLNRWGLVLEGLEHRDGVDVIDLRRPESLACAADLSIAWAYHLTKKRLIVPDSSTRIERCATDPRWEHVTGWATPPDGFVPDEWKQRREVQSEAARVMVKRVDSLLLKGPLRRAVAAEGWRPLVPVLVDEQTGECTPDLLECIRIVRRVVAAQSRAVVESINGDTALELMEYAENYLARYEPWLFDEFQLQGAYSRQVPRDTWTFETDAVPTHGAELLEAWRRHIEAG